MEQFGKSNDQPNTLDFANRNGILFEWNDNIDKYPEELVKEDVVFYPSLPAKIPGVVLEQDLPITTNRIKLNPKAMPRTPQHTMRTLSCLTLQEWMHQQSYAPTMTRLT